mmetsp:Transcript_39226/g.82032  ORF Transcript_39226/g.82032 Transcript_39226/m.82032 type:complete len:83 (+) Transcript_39226:1326-1574(+)
MAWGEPVDKTLLSSSPTLVWLRMSDNARTEDDDRSVPVDTMEVMPTADREKVPKENLIAEMKWLVGILGHLSLSDVQDYDLL